MTAATLQRLLAHAQTAEGRASRMALAVVAVLFALLAGAILATKGVIVRDKLHDLWILIDALGRVSAGQVPHLDFHNPVGQFFLLPYYFSAALGDVSGTALLHANLIAGTIILLLAVAGLAGRLWSPLFVATAMICLTTAISPRSIGDEITRYDHLAPYNRWAWSLIVIVGLVALVPREDLETRLRRVLDGVVVGLTVAALYYLKITFFVGAVGLVALGLVLRDFPLRAATVAALTFAVVAAVVELKLGNNSAYIDDILMAARANVDSNDVDRIRKLAHHGIEGLIYGGLVCILLWLFQPARNLFHWLQTWWRELVVGIALLLGASLLAAQNYPSFESPLFLAGVVAIAERGRRRARQIADPAPAPWMQPTAWLLVALVVPQYTLLDAASVVAHAAETRGTAGCRLRGLSGTPLADVMLPASGYGRQDAGAELLDRCDFARTERAYWSVEYPHEPRRTFEAVALLRRFTRSSDRLLVAEFSNPYSVVTGTVPVRGSLLWWHYGRSYSATAHPAASPMLADATMVLVGTPLHQFEHGEEWLSVYGDALPRDFRLVAATSYWQLWSRRGRSVAVGLR